MDKFTKVINIARKIFHECIISLIYLLREDVDYMEVGPSSTCELNRNNTIIIYSDCKQIAFEPH